MKILYLKIKNYIGVYNGTGMEVIEIDFSKCKNRITMLIGGNGSGKTSIVNTLHPYADGYENLRVGMDAYKQIKIIRDGYIYDITHYYTAKGESFTKKSYITKFDIDGTEIEMNPNGNHDTFIEVLESEFLLDPNFLMLSSLSMSGTSIVGMKAAERKKIVNDMLSDTEVYDGYYKTISKKFTEINNLLKNVAYKIASLKDVSFIDSSLFNANSRIEELNNERDNILSGINRLKGMLNVIDPDNKIRSTYETTMNDIETIRTENVYINANIQRIRDILLTMDSEKLNFSTYVEVNLFVNNIQNAITEIVTELDRLADEETALFKESQIILSSLEATKVKLSSVHRTRDYDEVSQLLTHYRNQVKTYDNVFKGYKPSYTADQLLIGYDILETIKESIINFQSEYSVSLLRGIEGILIHGTSSITNINKDIIDMTEEIKELEFQEGMEYGNIPSEDTINAKSNLLTKRPSACKDNTCPFIIDALNWKKELETLQNMYRVKEASTKHINAKKKSLEELNQQALAIREIEQILRMVHMNKDLLAKLPNSEMYINRNNLISVICQHVSLNNMNDFQDEITKVNHYEEYLELKKNKLPSLEKEMEVLTIQMDYIAGIEADIKRLSDNLDSLNEKMTASIAKKGRLEHRKNVLNRLMELLPELSSMLYRQQLNDETLKTHTTELKRLEDNMVKIKGMDDTISSSFEKANHIDKMIIDIQAEIDTLKYDKKTLESYIRERELLEERFGDYKELRDGLSPTKGIPLIYANLYLKNTRVIANKLLEMVFDGKYRLDAFIINEKKFEIPCIGNGDLNSDISTMSDGEKAIMGIILSFAFMYQSSSLYNVMRFDEVDAVLDAYNRSMYISILEEMMDGFNVEQAFIISHNDGFEAYPVDVILLKDAKIDNLSQKNIIWDYNIAS